MVLRQFIKISFPKTIFRKSPLHRTITGLTGFQPGDIDLYRCALTHRSLKVIFPDEDNFNNERLEYLGDAVLNAIIADYLFSAYPDFKEGSLTQMRARLVNRKTLNKIAVKMGFDRLMHFPKNSIPIRKHIFGNALEAFIGAVYIDKGFGSAKKFIVDRIITPYLDLDQIEFEDIDFKSRILQWGQKNRQDINFESHEVHQDGHHHPLFKATVNIMNMPAGEGQGKTKKEAQQLAARQALEKVSG